MRLARTIPTDELPRDEAGRLAFYAHPGGYPILYHCADGAPLCPICARDAEDGLTRVNWPTAWSIFLEGAPVNCANCRGEYRSAYGLLTEQP